jgi:hypothetical protein
MERPRIEHLVGIVELGIGTGVAAGAYEIGRKDVVLAAVVVAAIGMLTARNAYNDAALINVQPTSAVKDDQQNPQP